MSGRVAAGLFPMNELQPVVLGIQHTYCNYRSFQNGAQPVGLFRLRWAPSILAHLPELVPTIKTAVRIAYRATPYIAIGGHPTSELDVAC